MKVQFKTVFSLVIVSILLLPSLIAPDFALADGMVVRPDPFSDRWDYLGETNQQAFIHYENGFEKMILSVGMEETSESAVWIFPIPSEPNKVVIDVVTQFPRLSGEEISKTAKSNLFDIKKVLPATQIYTIPFIYLLETGTYRASMGEMSSLSLGGGMERAIETDVTVYEHLEKEGITTEIITAKTAQGLYQYLQNKNLKVEEGSISVLDHYIGKEFTFVVSWISKTAVATQDAQSTQRGVFVTFPTQKIYYPLLPTSVYESEVIPTTIRIIGHRSPKIFKDIKNYTETEYFIDNYVNLEEELKNFYNGPTEGVKYTKIEIKAPSKFLTDDLWISSGAPFKTYYSSFVAQYPLISGILLLILSSIIASVMAGWIVFKELRNKNGVLKLVLVGLSNCLSIIGLIMVTVLLGTKAKDENSIPLLNEIERKDYIWKRRLAVILFFVALLFLILGIVMLPMSMFSYVNLFLVLIFLVLTFVLKRIKREDKLLFAQLESAGYSSWSFNSKDKGKFVFVPLFSFSFLAISWLIIKLVEFTV
jgi:hypothetical protein